MEILIMEILKTESIVILTGAGISKESGLDTFRDNGGLWEGTPVEQVATPEAFQQNPTRVHSFYNARRAGLLKPEIKPNAAHVALAKLEQEWQGDVLLVTQNIDNLHERAGSEDIIHMHGELLKARCLDCDLLSEWRGDMATTSVCPKCKTTDRLRPNVVWFGEMPMQMDAISKALKSCDLFISIGTSGNVYPAAGFVDIVRKNRRGRTVELNLVPSQSSNHFFTGRYGSATEIVPHFISSLLQNIE